MEMQMEPSFVLTVVLTGLAVVFVGLIVLIFFVWLMGKFFDLIKSKKAAKTKAAAESAKNSAPAPSTPTAVPVPEVENGISDEIVAVIAAAVASMGSGYAVKSIRKSAKKSSRRNAWGMSGISESTKVF